MSSKLTHMPSILLDWNLIKKSIKPINDLGSLTFKTLESKTGQTMEQLFKNLMENSAQINTLKDPVEITKKMFSLWGISEIPKEMENQVLQTVKVDLIRGSAHFSVARCVASISIFLPMPLEEKMKVLFYYLDLDGDGTLDEKELHDGIRDFFIGLIHILETLLQPGVPENIGLKNANLDEIKTSIDQMKLVYTEEKINEIKDKCIAEADYE